MDELGSRESDPDFDLESGDTESSDEEVHEESSSDGKRPRKTMARARSGYLYVDGSIAASDGLSTSKNVSSIGENMDILANSMGKMAEGGMENRMGDKQKKKSPKKHPKPPRPPTGPSLHAADIELVNEISKRARLRRARRERMNALKRMKADKTSSSKINFLAMVVTAIFFLVIIFQGISVSACGYYLF